MPRRLWNRKKPELSLHARRSRGKAAAKGGGKILLRDRLHRLESDGYSKVIMSGIIRGSCLCGGVGFEVDPPFIRAGHCHCERCRKHSGTAVCTQTRVRKEQFRLLRGEQLIRVYGKGEGAVKAFCRTCGSSLFGGDWPDGPEVSIRMGAFDGDPGIRPQFHTFVNDRAPWDTITDDLPKYGEAWSETATP